MPKWAKLLLSANPTLETNMDMSPFASQVTLSKIILLQITLPIKVNQAPFKCLQRILRNIMHMLLNLNSLLHTRITLLCKLLNTKHLCTKFLGIMHLSCNFQSLHIKCLCTKGLLYHIFWNYVRPDSRLREDT